MKNRKIVTIILIITMVFALVACGGKGKEAGGNADSSEVVAKVGEEQITMKELEEYTYLYSFIQGIDLSNATEENMEQIKKMMLDDLIALNVMKIYYKDNEDVLPGDYKKSAEEFLKNVAKEEMAKDYMEKYKISDEAMKEFYVNQYYSIAFFDELEATLAEIKDEEVRAYYDDNKDEFKIDEVTAKHILVEKEELAKEILAKLKKGDDFSELAKEHGTDGTAEKGGDLGTFGRNVMDPDFENAAFSLKPGELSDVVKTQFGYHLILVTDKNEGMETFEEAQETIKTNLKKDALTQVYMDRVAELSEEIGVENYLNKEKD